MAIYLIVIIIYPMSVFYGKLTVVMLFVICYLCMLSINFISNLLFFLFNHLFVCLSVCCLLLF